MLESHEITDALPAQRDDEPPSLRRDIADEILDHLQAALRRELLVRGGDDNSAWMRVVEQFGDPRQVARRLWFQAMWSKIMTQRLVVISALVSMTLSVVLTAMVASMIHGQQQTNAALVDQMSKLVLQQKATSTPTPERDPRWNNLKIKVTLGSKTGPAAEGLVVNVSKLPDIGEVISEENGNNAAAKTTAVRKKLETETNAQGIVDCGFVSPGLYQLEVYSLTGESFSSTFTIYPGRDHIEEVVAPDNEPKMIDVSLHLEGLPEDLDSKKYGLVLGFRQTGSRQIDGQSWSSSGSFPFRSAPFLLILPGRGTWMTELPPEGEAGARFPSEIFYPLKKPTAKWRRVEQPYRFQIAPYQYALSFDFVRVPLEMTPDDPEWNRNLLHEPKDSLVSVDQGRTSLSGYASITLAAQPGKTNEWTVKLPNVLLDLWEQRAVTSPNKTSQGTSASTGRRNASRDWTQILPRTPNLVMEYKRNSEFRRQLQLTSIQEAEINRFSDRRSRIASDPTFDASRSDSDLKIEDLFKKIHAAGLEILTAEQKEIWEQRRVEMALEQIEEDIKKLLADEQSGTGAIARLRLPGFVTRMQLTPEQSQKLQDIESQLTAERKRFVEANQQTPLEELRRNWELKYLEFEKQFADLLTEEQKARLLPRTPPAFRQPVDGRPAPTGR